jgi:glycosyltransferase involved in cell wall biosynthesis
MEEQILYSIVVPIYGVEKYLNKCVDSLINQTYRNIEIILVDDGAKDNSPEICDHYASIDQRVKVIHKNNGGLVSARKAGAEIASGEYIFCVDGDDWVSTEYIEDFNVAISQYKPDLVCSGYVQTDEITEKLCAFEIDSGYYDHSKIKRDIYPIAIESERGVIFPPTLWAKAFKREIYLPEQLSVNNSIKIGEDGAVVKPILTRATSLYILDKCAYFYRVNDESMTKDKSAYDWNGPRYIDKHLRERIDLRSLDFEGQINRRTARDIYKVVFSQFNRDEKYCEIKKRIKEQLMAPDYKEVLAKCKYKGLKCKLEVFFLRHHLFLPIYLYHKLQRG